MNVHSNNSDVMQAARDEKSIEEKREKIEFELQKHQKFLMYKLSV